MRIRCAIARERNCCCAVDRLRGGMNGTPGLSRLPPRGVDGELQRDWLCTRCELRDGHVVSIARGPVCCAQDVWGNFRDTLGRRVPDEEHRARLVSPPPPFLVRVSVRVSLG